MQQDNRPVINPQDVLALLNDGKTREQIREHYGLSKRDLSLLFKHPDLKGKKTKIAPGFIFAQQTEPSDTEYEEVTDRENQTYAVEDEQADEQDSTESTGTQSEEQNLDSGVADSPSQWAN